MSVTQSVEDGLLDSIAALYEAVTSEYDLAFRRETDDLRHVLNHPNLLAVVTARRDESVVGVAPVALTETEDTLEAWVLDLVATDGSVLDADETRAAGGMREQFRIPREREKPRGELFVSRSEDRCHCVQSVGEEGDPLVTVKRWI